MILLMENAALNAIREFLHSGDGAVGTKTHVRHLDATPVGHRVCAEATVVKVPSFSSSTTRSAEFQSSLYGLGRGPFSSFR